MGDPACWLGDTCFACGRFLEPEDVRAGRCGGCGEPTPSAGAPGAADGDREDRPGSASS